MRGTWRRNEIASIDIFGTIPVNRKLKLHIIWTWKVISAPTQGHFQSVGLMSIHRLCLWTYPCWKCVQQTCSFSDSAVPSQHQPLHAYHRAEHGKKHHPTMITSNECPGRIEKSLPAASPIPGTHFLASATTYHTRTTSMTIYCI